MIHFFLFILIGIVCIIQWIEEVWNRPSSTPLPKNARYDSDAFWRDFKSGMSEKELQRKRRRGDYWVVDPPKRDASTTHNVKNDNWDGNNDFLRRR